MADRCSRNHPSVHPREAKAGRTRPARPQKHGSTCARNQPTAGNSAQTTAKAYARTERVTDRKASTCSHAYWHSQSTTPLHPVERAVTYQAVAPARPFTVCVWKTSIRTGVCPLSSS